MTPLQPLFSLSFWKMAGLCGALSVWSGGGLANPNNTVQKVLYHHPTWKGKNKKSWLYCTLHVSNPALCPSLYFFQKAISHIACRQGQFSKKKGTLLVGGGSVQRKSFLPPCRAIMKTHLLRVNNDAHFPILQCVLTLPPLPYLLVRHGCNIHPTLTLFSSIFTEYIVALLASTSMHWYCWHEQVSTKHDLLLKHNSAVSMLLFLSLACLLTLMLLCTVLYCSCRAFIEKAFTPSWASISEWMNKQTMRNAEKDIQYLIQMRIRRNSSAFQKVWNTALSATFDRRIWGLFCVSVLSSSRFTAYQCLRSTQQCQKCTHTSISYSTVLYSIQ